VLKNHPLQTAVVEAVGRQVLTPFLEATPGGGSEAKVAAVGDDELPMAGAEDFA
jgi:hypothetical protein